MTRNMTNYEFGDVVLVPFPFTDQTTTKKRPAIVVSSADYQLQRLDLILIGVTSQANPASSFGEMTIANWKNTGLIKPSIVKPVLTTLDVKLVIKKLGRLEEPDYQALQNLLKIILG
jgi:mRNA interferase MazF